MGLSAKEGCGRGQQLVMLRSAGTAAPQDMCAYLPRSYALRAPWATQRPRHVPAPPPTARQLLLLLLFPRGVTQLGNTGEDEQARKPRRRLSAFVAPPVCSREL